MAWNGSSGTLIESARAGDHRGRDEFARHYTPIVRAYFGARWRGGPLESDVDDGVQEVFVDCLRPDGALARSDPGRQFRPFLYGVARKVALRFEQRRVRRRVTDAADGELEPLDSGRVSSHERLLARQVMREASELQRARADAAGGVRPRYVELLQLRFQRGLSMAEIARLWSVDSARVHHMYAAARADFRRALREVVKRRRAGPPRALERECDWMLECSEPGPSVGRSSARSGC